MALYGQGATRGKTAILAIEATTNQACAAIRVFEERADFRFVFHALEYQYLSIRNLSNSGSQDNLSGELVKSIRIRIPPLHEQHVISFILSTIEASLSKTRQLVSMKELQKKGMMQQLLSGKKRIRGFREEWVVRPLRSLFSRVTRKNDGGSSEVVTISGKKGFVTQTDYFKKTIASEVLDDYFLIREGEFCYNKSYSNGYPWGAIKRLQGRKEAVVTTLYICFQVKEDADIDADFLEYFFESGGLNRGLMRIAHEGGRAHGLLNVTPSDFFDLPIEIPGKQEQKAIAQILLVCDREIHLLKAKAEKIRNQKKGLMQVLLTGKKRLKEFRE